MKNKKIIGLLLSLAMVLGVAMPGTLAVSAETESAAAESSVGTNAANEQTSETPLDDVNTDNSSAPATDSGEGDTDPAESAASAEFDAAAAYAHVMSLTSDDDISAYLASLTEGQYAALEAYAFQKETENAPSITSKVFTDAGPFLPAVNVTSVRRLMRSDARTTDETRIDNDGIVTSKTVTPKDDGSYTLRLESYVTGHTTTSTVTTSTPVDIVLVLDQSGSMADDFSGNSTSDNSERRQYAMKEAVKNFIGEVARKYSDECDNRMAIVTYGSVAATLQGWTVVNKTGETELKSKVAELPESPSGATNAGDGMQTAETLMGSGYSYTGTNTTRQKVVIMFTDGVPTTNSDFDVSVANEAITSAHNLKELGVTVYSVGIFNGCNPNQLYGEKIDYSLQQDVSCDGSVGSAWGASILQVIFGDVRFVDIAAGNRFLNYLSSNFKDATEIGISNTWKSGATCWEITKNFERTADGYYLTADDSGSLNEIFQTISDNIQTGTASVQLGSDTKVQDVISEYFELPDGAYNSITVRTACYNQNGTWGEEEASDLTAVIEDKTVTVTGFDFSQNYCSTENGRKDGDNSQSGDFYGRKLIIEIPIVVRADFLGGNDVPTNTSDSAVIAPNGDIMEQFEVPTANVTVKNPTVTAKNATVYEGGSVAVADLYTLPSYTWQDDYVTISGTVTDADANGNVFPSDCTDYTVNITYAPNTDGSSNEFGAADAQSNSGTATVHVLKPTVTATVNDVQKYYGESYTLGDDANGSIEVTWTDKTNGHTDIPAAIGTAPYDKDDLTLTYTTTTTAFSGQSGTVGKSDFDVDVSVVKENKDPVQASITTNCAYGCGDGATDRKYTVHVQTCQLTISKTDGADDEPYVFTVNKDGHPYTEVTIVGTGSETIYELPVGTYSITEDTGWSWRYSSSYGKESVTLSKDYTSDTITCTNCKTKDYWLNGFSDVKTNIFDSTN
ncbi:MAG: vWA domain-containing protein [Christensenellaceae bacterium]